MSQTDKSKNFASQAEYQDALVLFDNPTDYTVSSENMKTISNDTNSFFISLRQKYGADTHIRRLNYLVMKEGQVNMNHAQFLIRMGMEEGSVRHKPDDTLCSMVIG